MAWVNSRLTPVIVMSFYPLQAVLSPLLAVVFLGASVGAADIAGGTIVVGGLAACVAGQAMEQRHGAQTPAEVGGGGYAKLLADDSEAGRVEMPAGEAALGRGAVTAAATG